ncbi:MAG: putative ATPase [uncultured bacterium]|nr:MAG: putative ATPase [uncultured bacterium]
MQGKNKVLIRYLEKNLLHLIKNNYSCLIFGPRQTGKTSLVSKVFTNLKQTINYPLQNPTIKIDLEANPGKIINQIEALDYSPYVFIDEAQKIPSIFDSVQYLIDEKKAKFFLTGSSARKLRRKGSNLLPGRVKRFFLDPLLWGELGLMKKNNLKSLSLDNINKNPEYSFEDSLIYGALPGLVFLPVRDRIDFLKSYSEIYLEEEIRAEAISRKIGAFSRFLELAATESGTNPNLTKLSNESGVSLPAIKEFYQVLVDTLIVQRVGPYLKNARKRIITSSRFYFFDLGVRNVLSRLTLDHRLIKAQKGLLFEHAVVLEIIKRIRVLNKNYQIYYWRTSGGAEVDLVIDIGNKLIPIEIKASSYVPLSELKGLKIFLEDYKDQVDVGYVITLGDREERLAKNIIAIPWNCL